MTNHNFEPDWPTRRKAGGHCDWCGEPLTVGVTYATWGQVHDGYLGRLNMHPVCYLHGWKLFTEDDEFLPCEMKRGKPEYQFQ